MDGLIDQIVAICQIKHLAFYSAFKQPIYDLKRRVCLTGACGHRQQNAPLVVCNGIQRSVDGVSLIIARRICVLAGIKRLFDQFPFLFIQILAVFVSRSKFFQCRKSV